MNNKPGIPKAPVLKHDEDYNYLLGAGRNYIEELGSALWTDYNEHDPGITILEALCYAITELGYRTSLPIQDLLAQIDGTIPQSQTFFTAKKILTQSPLTVDDYRKLLIDINGIENAWLFTQQYYKDESGKIIITGEQPIFADKKNEQLTFSPTINPVYLNGLYKIILDLDDDPQLGDLNNGEIDIQIGSISLNIVFDAWNTARTNMLEVFNIDVNNIPIVNFPPSFDITASNLSIPFSFNGNDYTVTGKVTIGLQPSGGTLSATDIGNLFINDKNATQQVFNLYITKIIKASDIVQSATRELYKHRNLCEDFVTVETIKDEEIAFCFDIDVAPDVDIEEVKANVLFVIEQYLNPDVNFYLLSEMLQKINPSTGNTYTVNEIFEGPKLKHGFIDTNELENTNLRTEIYASEIISLIMNIRINNEAVIQAVRDFRMNAYDDDEKVISAQANRQWCIKVMNERKPVLSETKSKITIYKNGIPFLAREKETDETLEWLESLNARKKLISTADDIPVPTGNYFPLETYTSVQQLFPKTYALGNNALPPEATDERRAQANQLKGYLMFYDQLLADFFMQLKNAGELFSTDTIKQTYYAQFVNDFKDYDLIYAADNVANILLQHNVIDNQDATVAEPTPANAFEKLYETNETFSDRRNRFLDHLMARFSESFSEYVFMMYSLDTATQTETKIDRADLINSKIEFLSDYPAISYNRAKAFNYCPSDKDFHLVNSKLWNTDNVSGLEEKLCMLGGFVNPATGIKNYYRRFLRCIGAGDINVSVQPIIIGVNTLYNFVLSSSQLTFTSGNYASVNLLNTDLIQLINTGGSLAPTVAASGSGFIIQITVNGNIIQSNSFDNESDANAAFTLFSADLNSETCFNEGLYLIEHILLRPRNDNYILAPVCLDDDCESCCEEDPYSFRISIVLPYWVSRFNNMNFRAYFENIAREEAPAHCMVKVCWINEEAMLLFEICYKTWLQAMALYYSDKSDLNTSFLSEANNNLLNALNSLHSEYPVATLHDCDESKDINPVMLGKTVLGTFKN